MNWYNEIKIPLLTVGILNDQGTESLHQRAEALHKLVTETIIPALPGDSKGYTSDEEFLSIALRNKTVHARAKIIMMQFLDQIKNPELELVKVRSRITNIGDATVTEIFDELMNIMRKENPHIVKQMLLESGAATAG